MSRIGKRPIEIPSGVTVAIDPGRVAVTGPLGSLQQQVPQRMQIAQEDGNVTVTRPTERGEDRALHGLTRTLIANMVEGVTKGFEKKLEITGVGYRADAKGQDINLTLGFSHPIVYQLPPGVKASVEKQVSITLTGANRQVVGEVAAGIRKLRPPEPYKGKGVRYAEEHVRRKAGKAGKAGGK